METIPSYWKSRPVFISSTFKDMQYERDYLRSHVFPRLEEALRNRHHQLEFIDLRFGIDSIEVETEEEREMIVLKVCLNEIKRSRPFLIVLLGDRYGWIPPLDRMEIAVREVGFPLDVKGYSVTALEIKYGIIKENPDQRTRGFFYFRESLPYEEMSADVAALYSDAYASDPEVRSGHSRLVNLKQQLRTDPEFGSRVRSYTAKWDESKHKVTGLEAFGDLVFQDIWKELEEETRSFSNHFPSKWEKQESLAISEFIISRVRHFTGRKELLRHLHNIACEPISLGLSLGACLVGESGSGKSAIFAKLYQMLSAEDSIFILVNAAGSTPHGSSVDDMLRRWTQELADFLGINNPATLESSSAFIENTFYSLFKQAAEKHRLIVLVDALEKFEATSRSYNLTWFRAKQWPTNARIIATSLPDPRAEEFQQWAGVEELVIPPLTFKEAEQISRAVWTQYHQPVEPKLLEILTDKRLPEGTAAYENPLWLVMALEQLSLLDADDFARVDKEFTGTPNERLRALKQDIAGSLPADIKDVYNWLLMQTEKVYGDLHTQAFAVSIALSRHGWRENDLLKIIPQISQLLFPKSITAELDDLGIATLRRGFRAHLVRRGNKGVLDFFHAQMRVAIQRRYPEIENNYKQLHSIIVDHLMALPSDDPMHESETMFHLIKAKDQDRTARYYASNLSEAEIKNATRDLAHTILGENDEAKVWTFSLLRSLSLTLSEQRVLYCRFLYELYENILTKETTLDARLEALDAIRIGLEHILHEDPILFKPTMRRLAQSGFKDHKRRIAEPGRLYPEVNFGLLLHAVWMNIAEILRITGDKKSSVEADRRAGVLFGRLLLSSLLTPNFEWRKALSKLVLDFRKTFVKDSLREKHLEIKWIRAQLKHEPENERMKRDLAVGLDELGVELMARGEASEALKIYHEARYLFKNLLANNNDDALSLRDLAQNQSYSAEALIYQGDSEKSLEMNHASLATIEKALALEPTDLHLQRQQICLYNNIGSGLATQGFFSDALDWLRRALKSFEKLSKTDPNNLLWHRDIAISHFKLAAVHYRLEDPDLARNHLEYCRDLLAKMRDSGNLENKNLIEILERLESGPIDKFF